MVLKQLDIYEEKINCDFSLKPYTKIKLYNSRWITDLNIKNETVKLLDKNIGENLGNKTRQSS